MYGDDNLYAIEELSLTSVCRSSVEYSLTSDKHKVIEFINSAIVFLGITVLSFCALFSILLRKEAPNATTNLVNKKASILRELKHIYPISRYKWPDTPELHSLSINAFCNARRYVHADEIYVIAGFLVDTVWSEYIYHLISWTFHRAKQPVKSITSAKIFAAGEAIDTGKLILNVYRSLLDTDIELIIVTGSRDLFTALSTQWQSIDKSIRGDVGVMQYEFETQTFLEFVSIFGKPSLTDISTRLDRPLTSAVNQLLQDGSLQSDFEQAEMCSLIKPHW